MFYVFSSRVTPVTATSSNMRESPSSFSLTSSFYGSRKPITSSPFAADGVQRSLPLLESGTSPWTGSTVSPAVYN